ncbi:hypothetical protein [Beggiatoa leptomitoformis]|uniref:Uncharacterized protein n=1 Tax=Beggiatoa leptomitoformis TaxID=288004 RepID=A0A2N9YCT8_9GAMM|nr:hypothetical protein [Beggiatoa leptomitoformis]ALG66439.1 hypothetical protein AL038_00150 [Beggiatoa leptomitoformis]AUI68282.1 hypothetical protein BLE401_05925 [Beggiatoa leptomitoformis]
MNLSDIGEALKKELGLTKAMMLQKGLITEEGKLTKKGIKKLDEIAVLKRPEQYEIGPPRQPRGYED